MCAAHLFLLYPAEVSKKVEKWALQTGCINSVGGANREFFNSLNVPLTRVCSFFWLSGSRTYLLEIHGYTNTIFIKLTQYSISGIFRNNTILQKKKKNVLDT